MLDLERVAQRIRQDNAKEAQVLEQRRTRAQALGRKLARNIIDVHPEVMRVWGFGSAFEIWRSFRMNSDIDLAVESGDITALLSLVEDLEFTVDLIDLSSCHEAMADFVRTQGVVLAEVPS